VQSRQRAEDEVGLPDWVLALPRLAHLEIEAVG